MSDTIIKIITKRTNTGGKKAKRPDNRPARQRYNAERRWLENKAKRMAKDAKRQKATTHLMGDDGKLHTLKDRESFLHRRRLAITHGK